MSEARDYLKVLGTELVKLASVRGLGLVIILTEGNAEGGSDIERTSNLTPEQQETLLQVELDFMKEDKEHAVVTPISEPAP